MPRVTSAIVTALLLVSSAPAHAQIPDAERSRPLHSIADAMAAGIVTYSNGAFAPLICVRLLGVDGQDLETPNDLPYLVRTKLRQVAGMPPETKSIEGCSEFFERTGDAVPESLIGLLVTARRGEARTSDVRVHLRGHGGSESYLCSLPESPTLFTITSECVTRAR